MQAWFYVLAGFVLVGRHRGARHFGSYGKVVWNLTHSNHYCIARKVVPAVRTAVLVAHIAALVLQIKPHLVQQPKTAILVD